MCELLGEIEVGFTEEEGSSPLRILLKWVEHLTPYSLGGREEEVWFTRRKISNSTSQPSPLRSSEALLVRALVRS